MRTGTLLILALLLSLAGVCLGAVVIKEVELSPPLDERGRDESQWVKLYNSGGDDVDISGWSLIASQGHVTIPEGAFISAYGTYKVEQEDRWLQTVNETLVLTFRDAAVVDRTPPMSDSARDEYVWSRIGIASASTIQDWSFQAASRD